MNDPPRRGPPSYRESLDITRSHRRVLAFEAIVGRPLIYDTHGMPIRHPFDWLTEFNVAGATAYRPETMNASNRGVRDRMLDALFTTSLPSSLAGMRHDTYRDNRERHAHVFTNGTIGEITTGDRISVDRARIQAGAQIMGEVHTHPAHPPLMAPPSVQDLDSLAFGWPLLLVVEQQRLWGIFPPRHTALLGRLDPSGAFEQLSPADRRANTVWRVLPQFRN